MAWLGCVSVILLVLLVAAWIGANRTKAAATAMAEKRARGIRITELFQRLEREPSSARIVGEIERLLTAAPVGYFPELVSSGGWFDRSRTALSMLWHSPYARLIDLYFRSFSFPVGRRSAVLQWFNEMLQSFGTNAVLLEKFQQVGLSFVSSGGADEAQWLYEKTLDAVQQNSGHPNAKAVALVFGRASYAFGRVLKQPTVYDEQAIANDISARVPTQAV